MFIVSASTATRMNSNSKNKVVKFQKICEDPIQYLEIYFRLAYYFCTIPFRFDEVRVSSIAPTVGKCIFVLRRRTYQQVLCYVVYGWSLYKYFPSIHATKFNQSKISSFDIVTLMVSFGTRASFMFFMIVRQTDILDIINFLRDDQWKERKTGSSRFYRTGKITWLWGALTLLYTCIGIVYTVLGVTVVDMADWSPENVWSAYVGQAKFNVFMSESTDPVLFTNITTVEHLGTLVYIILKCTNQLLANFMDFGFLSISVLFFHLARDFENLLKEQPPSLGGSNNNRNTDNGEHIINKFWRLRHFINEKVNIIYGSMMLWWMMEAILYYSCYLDSVFNEKNHIIQFRNILFVSTFLGVLFLSSDANYKISKLKEWVLKRQQMMMFSESDLMVTLNVLTPCDVGIRAFGFFTVTFELMGTIAHVIITYAVILVNLQADKDRPAGFYGYNNIL